MKVTVLTWCVSFLPILLLVMLLAVFRISAARAAGVTLLVTALSALVVYKADVQLVLFESLKGVWSTATILYIIFPALLLYERAVFLCGLFLGYTNPGRFGAYLVTWLLSLALMPVLYPIVLSIGKIGGETWKE